MKNLIGGIFLLFIILFIIGVLGVGTCTAGLLGVLFIESIFGGSPAATPLTIIFGILLFIFYIFIVFQATSSLVKQRNARIAKANNDT